MQNDSARRPEAIEVADLHKSFGTHKVLKGVSLRACEGDVVAIIGGSGSGKSTMLRCINFLETPTSGTISVAGEAVAMRPDGSPADRRRLNASASRWGWCSSPSTSGPTARCWKT
jgi:octopine/nopaline transport system ATP-binding protein